MAPVLLEGDLLLVRRPRSLRRGAVVVAWRADRGLVVVKRLVGLPGDAVVGRVLGPDEHWLLGDNAAASDDSRSLGPFPRSALLGVARLRYWPPARIRPLP
jgi:signal peptidase I